MGVNGTPVLFGHVSVLQEHYEEIRTNIHKS